MLERATLAGRGREEKNEEKEEENKECDRNKRTWDTETSANYFLK
jgi:hypothetical protein